MPRKPDQPPIDFEAEYDDAFNRIIAKLPRNTVLRAKLLEGKKIPPNPTNVALEAGHSRSKLYECAGIISRIAEHGKQASSAKTEKIDNLKAENAALGEKNSQLLSAMAAMLLRMQKLEKESKKEGSKKARQDNRSKGNTVLPFRNREDGPS